MYSNKARYSTGLYSFCKYSIPNVLNPKSVIVYSNILYTFAFVNDIKKWNKAVRSFVQE